MLTNSDEQSAGLSVAQVVELLDAVAGEPEDDAANVFERLSSELPAGEAAGLVDRLRDLRSLLARWRRRGQELSALFSSARELAELRDTDALLHRLVERAHALMSTDVTYLSEFYEGSDELRVRSTLGSVAPSFRDLRVPPGMGVASKVVRTRCPQWTSVYRAHAWAMRLLLLAERLSAREALRYGLLNEVVPADEVLPTAIEWAERLAGLSGTAVATIKEAVLRLGNLPPEEAFHSEALYGQRAFGSPDAAEGLAAFRQKRDPVFPSRRSMRGDAES